MVDPTDGPITERRFEVTARRIARRRLVELTVPAVTAEIDPPYTTSVLIQVESAVVWIIASIGLPVRRTLDAPARRLRGAAVLFALGALPVTPVLAMVIAVIGWQLPVLSTAAQRRRETRALLDETLFAAELCAVAFHTGMTVPECIDAVAPHLDGRLGEALARVSEDRRSGMLLDEALAGVGARLGETVMPFVAILRAAHVDGDPVTPAMTRLADRLREDHRRLVATDTRRLSIRLLLPLVCCSLPGFVLIAIVPTVAGVIAEMSS